MSLSHLERYQGVLLFNIDYSCSCSFLFPSHRRQSSEALSLYLCDFFPFSFWQKNSALVQTVHSWMLTNFGMERDQRVAQLSESSVLAHEQHLGVSMTTVNTICTDFTTNRFDREYLQVLGGSLKGEGEGNLCLTVQDVATLKCLSS